MKRISIMITGGEGFIGKSIVNRLALSGNEYLIFVPSRKTGFDLLIEKEVKRHIQAINPDVIIHCAYGKTTMDMITQFTNILKYYKGKIIYYGSGAEYDNSKNIKDVVEEDVGKNVPQDQYGHGKYLLNQYCYQRDNVYNLRLFGCYGINEDYSRRFISKNICRVLNGLPIVIYDDREFSYVHVEDVARITEWFVNDDVKGTLRDFNVVTNEVWKLSELADLILSGLNKEDTQVFYNYTNSQARNYCGKNNRLLSVIGDYKFIGIVDGIIEMCDYFRENINKIDLEKIK